MKLLKEMTMEQKAEVGEKVIQMMIDTANMSLLEKEHWIKNIPKDYKLENDMTIVKFRIWTEIRQELVDKGYLGAVKTAEGQQALDV